MKKLLLAALASIFVVVAPAQADIFIDVDGNLIVLGNGYNLAEAESAARFFDENPDPDEQDSTVIIGTITRISGLSKNGRRLIKKWPTSKQQDFQINFVIECEIIDRGMLYNNDCVGGVYVNDDDTIPLPIANIGRFDFDTIVDDIRDGTFLVGIEGVDDPVTNSDIVGREGQLRVSLHGSYNVIPGSGTGVLDSNKIIGTRSARAPGRKRIAGVDINWTFGGQRSLDDPNVFVGLSEISAIAALSKQRQSAEGITVTEQ